MDILTNGLNGEARKIDNGGAGIMAVHVENINTLPAGPIFSITHYYEQNGDLMSDPDMTFLKGFDGNYYPLSFQQDNVGLYQDVVAEYDDKGNILKYRPRLQMDLVSFANMWMKNIKEQQRL